MVKVIVTSSAIWDAKEIFSHYEACSSHNFAKKLLKELLLMQGDWRQCPKWVPKSLCSDVTTETIVMYSYNADTNSFTFMKKKPVRF